MVSSTEAVRNTVSKRTRESKVRLQNGKTVRVPGLISAREVGADGDRGQRVRLSNGKTVRVPPLEEGQLDVVELSNGKRVKVPAARPAEGERDPWVDPEVLAKWRGWILAVGMKIDIPHALMSKWKRFMQCGFAYEGHLRAQGIPAKDIARPSSCHWYLCPHCHTLGRKKKITEYKRRLQLRMKDGDMVMMTIKAPSIRLSLRKPVQHIKDVAKDLKRAQSAVLLHLRRLGLWQRYVYGLHAKFEEGNRRVRLHYHVVARGELPAAVQRDIHALTKAEGCEVQFHSRGGGREWDVAAYITNRVHGMFIGQRERRMSRNRDEMAFSKMANNLAKVLHLEAALHGWRWSGASRLPAVVKRAYTL